MTRILEIIQIVEGVASLAIRYQSYYDQYKKLSREVDASLCKPSESRNQLLHQLTETFSFSITAFEGRLVQISEAMYEPKKKGFFEGLFGGGSPQKQEEPKSSGDGDFRFLAEEQKWHFFSEEDEAYFVELQSKRKSWMQKAEDLKTKDVMKKELLDFTLNNNLLNGVLYETTFRALNCNI